MSHIRTPDLILKGLTRQLIGLAGGLEAAAAWTGIGKTTLAEYYAPASPSHVPVDALALLEEGGRACLVTAELARRSGHMLMPVAPATADSIGVCFAALVKETGETLSAYAAGMADGTLTPAEKATVARETAELIRAGQAMLAALA